MPSRDRFEQALDAVEENLEKAGENVVDSITAEVEDGENREGFHARHGNHDLTVLGAPSDHFFQVSYTYIVVNQFAQQIALSELTQQQPDEAVQVEVQNRHQQQASQQISQILENQDEEKKQKLRRKIVQMLVSPHCAYQLVDADDGSVVGFQISRHIWPYEDDFAPSKVHRACQTVVSTGLPVTSLLQRQFGLGQAADAIESTGEGITQPEDRTPRGFQ